MQQKKIQKSIINYQLKTSKKALLSHAAPTQPGIFLPGFDLLLAFPIHFSGKSRRIILQSIDDDLPDPLDILRRKGFHHYGLCSGLWLLVDGPLVFVMVQDG